MQHAQEIWVIDDDPADRHLTLWALESTTSAARRGFESLRSAAAALEGGARPDIVFVDWTLPGEDTRTAPNRIGRYGAWTCLLTNLDCAMIPERTAFDAFASKPYGFDALCALLQTTVQRWEDATRRQA
jgi:DNA-binding NtrC family response regulator